MSGVYRCFVPSWWYSRKKGCSCQASGFDVATKTRNAFSSFCDSACRDRPLATSATLPCTPDFDRLTGSRTRISRSTATHPGDSREATKVSLLRRGSSISSFIRSPGAHNIPAFLLVCTLVILLEDYVFLY